MWIAVVAVHAALLLLAMRDRPSPPPVVSQQTMMVSFIAAPRAAPVQPPQPEPTPPREIPKPKQRMVASSRSTPSPIVTAPPEDVIDAPVELETAPVSESAPTPTQDAMVPPDYLASSLNNPGPQYPHASRRRREEGTVMLKVLVGVSGTAEQVLVDASSGFASLDEAAADIVRRRWRFVPATQNNRPVSAWVHIPMVFELKNR